MTIIQLEYLLAVVGCGSFSAASDRCFVTQPSLSMQIKNLEGELGIVLLDRTKKPVVPTQAGQVVVERAREAIIAYNHVRESVEELKGNISGRLRLGVIPTISPYLLPLFVHEFCERYPKVDLEIRELITPMIIEALDHDDIDAAIVAGGTLPQRFVEQELFSDRFYAYLSTQNHLIDRNNIRIEDIDPKDLILLAEGHCLRDQILELCGQTRNQTISYRFQSGSLETLMRIVDTTSMVTIIPEMTVRYVSEEHRRQVKTLARGATSRKITLAVRRTYAKESLVKVLGETIVKSIATR